MEKSMVQELNFLTYSNVFSSRPSFISTHISDPDINELRRSRIQNLPGHKKEDLSSKLNMVVVFQTIEIERLSRQIESLRVNARDWQRQKLNYENYQVQIRQLTEKCHMYEVQREGMQDQSEKMKIFCEKLYRQFQQYKAKYGEADSGLKEKYNLARKTNEQLKSELQKWRNRFTSQQRSKTKELEEMRLKMQEQRKSSINREIKQITIKYENELQTLSAQLRKAREEGQWRASEMQRLQHVVNGFSMREKEMKQIEDKVDEYENRYVLLSQQNYRLNELLRWKVQELNRLKQNQSQLRSKLQGTKNLEDVNKTLKGQLSKLTQEITESRVFTSRTSEQLQRLQFQNQKLVQYQKLVDKSAEEIERLNSIIHTKINQLDQYKNSLKIIETKLNAVNNATQKQFASYEQKMLAEAKEKERLNALLKSRLVETENFKAKIAELEKALANGQVVERQNNDLKMQINNSYKKMEEFKAKIIVLEESVSIMEDLKQTLKSDEKIKAELTAERERLNSTIRNLTLQLETSNQKLSAMQAQYNKYTNLQIEIKQHQQRLAYITQQIDKINAQIQLRVGELHQIRQNLKSLSNSKQIYQDIEQKLVRNLQQMQRLILQLDENRRQNERLQNNNMNLQLNMKKMQGDLIAINQEREQLNQLFNQKSSEVNRLNETISTMAAKVSEHRTLQQQNQQYQRNIEIIRNNYQQLEVRFKNQIKKTEEYSQQVQGLCSQLLQLRQQPKISTKMAEEIVFLRKQWEEKNTIIAGLNKRIATIENILRMLKQRYLMQIQVGEDMRRKVESMTAKINFVEEVVDMANRYSEQLEKVNETNMMLESQKRLLDLQMCESMRVVDVSTDPKPTQMTTTFGQPTPSHKNELIINNPPTNIQNRQTHSYTFKEITSNRCRSVQPSHLPSSEENRYYYKQQPQLLPQNEVREPESLSNSFIHTLTNKDPIFESEARTHYQNINNPSFGKNVTVSTMRYVGNTSPTAGSRPIASSFISPTTQRTNEVRYITIDSQIENAGNQASSYINPFQDYQPQMQSGILENPGVKRVTSYTHFPSYSGSSIHPNMMQVHQMIPQQNVPSQDVPNIRILEALHSPNIANSIKVSSQYGKPIRISSDNASPQLKYHKQ